MNEAELIDILCHCRALLREAVADHDWDRVSLIDQQILALVQDLAPEQRQGSLSDELEQLRTCYQEIMAISDARRRILQEKMGRLRTGKNALAGYKVSMCGAQQTVRV